MDKISQNIILSGELLKREKEYWLARLDGKFEMSGFPADLLQSQVWQYERAESVHTISDETLQKLVNISRGSYYNSYVILLAVFSYLLHVNTGNEDIIVGMPVFRQDGQAEYINDILAIRNNIYGSESFKELLVKTKQIVNEAIDYQNIPFSKLFELIGDGKKTEPMFKTIVLLENIHDKESIEYINADIVFSFLLSEDSLKLVVTYNSLLYTKPFVECLYEYFRNLLSGVLTNLDKKLCSIDLLSEEEKKTVLFDFNNTSCHYPYDKSVAELFEEQARKCSDEIALVFNNESLSYYELNRRANILAALLKDKGIKPGSIVGIILDRTPNLVIAILGVLKAKGAYLPIDHRYPVRRILSIIEDCGVSVILSEEECVKNIPFTKIQGRFNNAPEVVLTAPRPQIKDFNSIPIPDRTLVDYGKYHKYIGQGMVKNSIAIQATRGCPYNCAFCHKIWPKSHVARTAENIYNEIKICYDAGIRRFVFIDDIFNLDLNNSSELFKLIIKNHLNVQMFFPQGLRGDILTREYIDLMIQAGTVSMALSLETASPRLQKLIGKNLNLDRFKENIEYIVSKYPGFILELFTMHGLPSETEEEAMMTMEFIKSIKWIHFPYIHILKIYPGTDMEKLAMENGISAESISESLDLAYHELPETLPFGKDFTQKYQAEFFSDYFLSKERLLKVLPMQMKVLTEDELVQKYNSYIPARINSFADLLDLARISEDEITGSFLSEDSISVPYFTDRIKKYFPESGHDVNALRILFLDLSQMFQDENNNTLYSVVEAPLGHMYLLTHLNNKFGKSINGKIAKSGMDFNSFAQLKKLIDEFKPDVIGIRTLTIYRNFFHKTISLIKQWNVGIPIVAGGPYATSDFKRVLEDHNVDLVILGEGEDTLSELVEKMLKNGHVLPEYEEQRTIKGIAFTERTKKSEIETPHREVIWMNYLGDGIGYGGEHNPQEAADPENPVYVIFTSGSTGIPKGVTVKTNSFVNLLNWYTTEFNLDHNDRILMLSSPCFDLTQKNFFAALINGGRLYLPPSDNYDVELVSSVIESKGITVINCTPSAFYPLLEHNANSLYKRLKTLRYVFLGGEPINMHRLKPWYNSPYHNSEIVNTYGPTECTDIAAFYRINIDKDGKFDSVPIGKPINNVNLYVMGNDMELLPVGVPGELYIGGTGLSNGYLNDSVLNEEKFIEISCLSGEKVYKTGDRVRWLRDGNIEFIGRMDNQVKIRGYRIETGEIEAQLRNFSQIRDVVVTAVEDKYGMASLAAYLVVNDGFDVSELKKYLSLRLPEYMIPSYFVLLESLPLTANGKVDRKSLPDPCCNADLSLNYEAPANDTESKLVEMLQDILGLGKIGVFDNFFEAGGDSLKATTFISRIHKEFDIQILLKDILDNMNIRAIAEYIKSTKKKKFYSIKRIENIEYYPVSSAQARLFLQNQFEGIGLSYNMPAIHIVKGRLDTGLFEEMFIKLVKRHEAFRTTFELVNGEIVQKISDKAEFKIEYYQNNSSSIDEIAAQFFRQFDLSNAPLLRVGLIEVSESEHILMTDMHHIISDGISAGIIINEINLLMAGKSLPELTIQYRDFAVWENEYLNSGRLKSQEEFWLNTLAGEIPVMNMPCDFKRSDIRTYAGETIDFEIPVSISQDLIKLARSFNITLNSLLISIYSILLSKYTGQTEIIIGSTVAGRRHSDLENVIGVFINFIPVKVEIDIESSLRDFFISINRKVLDAYDNQDYPYDRMVEKLYKAADNSRNPLFDTMLVFHNEPEQYAEFKADGLSFLRRKLTNHTSKLDFKIDAGVGTDGKINCSLEYNTSLFKRQTMERLITHFVTLIQNISINSEAALKDIDMLTGGEIKQILECFNNTAVAYPKEKTIHELFEQQAEKTPDKAAVVCEDTELTYKVLNQKSNQLARALKQSGVRKGDIVGIAVSRSIDMVISIFGVLKAGAACLPLDLKYPKERISIILNDSGTQFILKNDLSYIIPDFTGKIIDINWEKLEHYSADNINETIEPDSLAYMIYTSGSTGRPKGVMLHHTGIINHAFTKIKELEMNTEDSLCHNLSINFVASIWQVFSPLFIGAKVVVLPENVINNSYELFKQISEKEVSILEVVPSLMNSYLDLIEEGQEKIEFAKLKMLILTGEKVTPTLVNKFYKKYDINLMNAYGQSESSDDTLHYRIPFNTETEIVPIGKPSNNTTIYVMDMYMRLAPVGITGELCVSGDGLSKGYINKPELTDEKFITNPYDPSKRLYCTGDIAKWMVDGNVEYIGRKDHQVKIRGFRIELGEIEYQLLNYKHVRSAAVIDKEGADANNYICAFIVPDKQFSMVELRTHLSEKLPGYMIPSYITCLDEIPLTPNGKIDRKALPEPEKAVDAELDYKAPSNRTEEKLAEIWSELLGFDKIGIEDNFFELGGHSLKLALLASKIHKVFDVEIPFAELFSYPTIRELSLHISQSEEKIYSPIQRIEEKDYYAVLPAQEKIYIKSCNVLKHFENASTSYNMWKALIIDGYVDKQRIEAVCKEIIGRHEILRTSFIETNTSVFQQIHKEVDFNVNFIEAPEDMIQQIIKNFIKPFDLSTAPLLRVQLVTVNSCRHLMIFDMHHIITDGVSMDILAREFIELYNGRTVKKLNIQYRDYSAWQDMFFKSSTMQKQENYWLERFASEIPVLDLPTDHNRPPVHGFRADRVNYEVSIELVNELKNIALKTNTSLYMVMLSAFYVLLAKYSGQDDIVVGSPIAGRKHADLENMIGLFVNTMAIRSYPCGSKVFAEFLNEVKQSVLNANDNSDYPFELLVEKLNVSRDLSRNPVFDVMFNFIDEVTVENESIIKFKPYEFNIITLPFDLELTVVKGSESIKLYFDYGLDLFDRSTIETMTLHYINIIQALSGGINIRINDINMMGHEDIDKRLSIAEEAENIEFEL